MASARVKRCLFCGEPFAGQKRNFEHIIPRWVVEEADLNKRTTAVRFPHKRLEVGMSRIGLRACESCNSDASDLEGAAKAAYLAIKEGRPLTDIDKRALLDWLDKVRVGLWLWLVDAGRESIEFDPKFRINQRLAHKDRIILIARYPDVAPMRGLALWGTGEFFITSPSVIGLLINNVALVSASADFLLARHLVPLSIRRAIYESGEEGYDIEPAQTAGPRLRILGNPSIFGQCILPSDMFSELGLPVAAASAAHEGWSEGPIVQLDDQLAEISASPIAIPAFGGNLNAHTALMEMNADRIFRFLFEDLLGADLTNVSEAEARAGLVDQARGYIRQIDAHLLSLKAEYRNATGLWLPF